MYVQRPVIAVGLSMAVNLAILYGISSSQHVTWQLDNSQLSIGAETQALLQKLTISTPSASKQITKQPASTNQTKKSIAQNTQQPIKSMPQPQPEDLAQPASSQTEDTAAPSAKAQPQIQAHKAQLAQAAPPLIYPDSAIKNGLSGKVTLSARISHEGSIQQIQILRSSGYPELDEAAIAWFKQLKFTAAHDGQQPISSNVKQVITFSLKEATHEA